MTLEEIKSRHGRWLALFFMIFAIGLFFRFFHLYDRGLINSDGIILWKEVEDAVTNNIYYWYFAKPGHLFLLWVGAMMVGFKDFVPVLVSSLSGLATVGVTYLIGKRLYGFRTGLLAAALLSVSPWHIFFSRTSGSSVNSILFWTMALYFYILSRPDLACDSPSENAEFSSHDRSYKWLICAGLSMGYSFTCHYNMGMAPLYFLLFELHYAYARRRGSSVSAKNEALHKDNGLIRLFSLFSAMLVPLVFFNFLHMYMEYRLISEIPYDPSKNEMILSYFQQIFIQLKSSTSEIWGSPSSFAFWIKLIGQNEGWIFFVLALLGFLYHLKFMIKNNSLASLIPLLPIIISLAFLANAEYTAKGRSFSLAVPLLALLAAHALSVAGERLKNSLWIFSIPCFILVYNLPVLISQVQISTPKQGVQDFLKQNQIKSIIAQGEEIVYLVKPAVSDIRFSPNWNWTREQVQTALQNQQKVEPNFLMAEFKTEELQTRYHCQPQVQWANVTGRSDLGFEMGKVKRVWDFTLQRNSELLIGFFLIDECIRP
ncbi:MAG: ArnT family glycosyltransferase [Nitrospinales bacterium]